VQYLDAQITKYLNKPVKTEPELEREQSLVEQRFYLTEERHFVMVPAPGSGVPGAPADWEPPEGMEQHTPVLFLDLNADDFSTGKKINSIVVFTRAVNIYI
jgi:kinesin family protein 13